jgi:hypothetical protein
LLGSRNVAGDRKRPGGEIRSILDRRFRANPAFRLIGHELLPAAQQETFVGLAEDPDHYGVLVPCENVALGVHAVDRIAAHLYAALRTPGPLPDQLQRNEDENNRRVAALVLDGVLEIEREGQFLSGAQAHPEILCSAFQAPEPQGRIAQLSHTILRRAQALPLCDVRKLCAWIYASGAVPVGPGARQLRDWPAVARFVGLDEGGRGSDGLAHHYHRATVKGWSTWQRRDGSLRYLKGDGRHRAYKLYISPRPAALRPVFAHVVDCVIELGAPAFKLGCDAFGLHRPDKLIVYFDAIEQLQALARVLDKRLEGHPAQGVPFTAALGETGMLSWGVDPPRQQRTLGWSGSESWRIWLAARLARGIRRAQAAPVDGVEPWVCALDRVRVEGVDTDRWLPTRALWDTQSASADPGIMS